MTELLNTNPNKVFTAIQKERSASSQINVLRVGSKVYTGDDVCDGFFDSLSKLKSPDMSKITNSEAFSETIRDYNNIIGLAKSGAKLPQITINDTVEIL